MNYVVRSWRKQPRVFDFVTRVLFQIKGFFIQMEVVLSVKLQNLLLSLGVLKGNQVSSREYFLCLDFSLTFAKWTIVNKNEGLPIGFPFGSSEENATLWHFTVRTLLKCNHIRVRKSHCKIILNIFHVSWSFLVLKWLDFDKVLTVKWAIPF